MKLRTLSLLAGLAVLGSAQASPVVLYDNLTPNGYSGTTGWTIGSVSTIAQMFTPTVGATLTQLQLALSSFEPVVGSTNTPLYDILLVDSVPSSDPMVTGIPFEPGTTVLHSWSAVPGQGLNVLNFGGPVSVSAGSNYWVVVKSTPNSNASGLWHFNANGQLATQASQFGSVWLGEDENLGGGMKVIGETGVPVPEPATVALAGLALGLAARRRRNR